MRKFEVPKMTLRKTGALVLCCVLLAGCGRSESDSIFGRGGKTQWIAVPEGRLKADVYSTTTLNAHPVLVIVLHGPVHPNAKLSIRVRTSPDSGLRRARHAGPSARAAGHTSGRV